jgi:CHAD domain-containing protein
MKAAVTYQLEIAEPIDVGVRRIATELIDAAIGRIQAQQRDRDKVVHEVRKVCKKLRGLLRLIRPQVPELYKVENEHIRGAAATLSGVRDVKAATEAYDALLETFEGEVDRRSLAPVRRALTMHRKQLDDDATDLDARLNAFGERMHEIRKRVPDWCLPADDPNRGQQSVGLLGDGLAKTYARGRKAMAAAYEEPGVEAFHEWRKRAKYLRYHLQLLSMAWPRLLKRSCNEVEKLGRLLGDDHDLAVLATILTVTLDQNADRDRIEVLNALMGQRSVQLRDQAKWLGSRIYAEKPKAFRKRIDRYWDTARDQYRAANPAESRSE